MRAIRRVLGAMLFGSRSGIAGSVYGAIVVMGTLTAGSAGGERHAWKLAVATAGTVMVLWMAHVYSTASARAWSRSGR